jgi:putative ABC transport system permease protein
MKALGAPAATIRNAFLAEAVLLSISGAFFGYLIGEAGAFILRSLYPTLPAFPPNWAIIAAVGTSVSTGLLFGVMPARRAARLDPVLALSKR